MSKKYEKKKRQMADPTPARLETESKSYREQAEYDADNAIFELHLYKNKYGDYINLKNAAQHIKLAMKHHIDSDQIAGNTLPQYIDKKQEAKT
jgi:hypothetical protein